MTDGFQKLMSDMQNKVERTEKFVTVYVLSYEYFYKPNHILYTTYELENLKEFQKTQKGKPERFKITEHRVRI
jgi:hypothetical protein